MREPGPGRTMLMGLYSLVLALAVVMMSPWWLWRLVTRDRDWLRQRLSSVSSTLRATVKYKRVVWLHAVSVGEVLAATRLVAELETALGPGWRIVVSTTTRTGQELAKERFGAARVFYFQLDFEWAVRRYLRALRPCALVLMESEVWPRMLHECRRRRIPVAVVNARVSDRSFRRAMRVRFVWKWVLKKVSLWLAQSEEDARRLVAMGASESAVKVGGNLKYDVRAPQVSRVAKLIEEAAGGRPIVVAGSTVGGEPDEEAMVLRAWERLRGQALLVLAPRHPERFAAVEMLVREFRYVKASEWAAAGAGGRLLPQTIPHPSQEAAKDGPPGFVDGPPGASAGIEVVLLDTIGDLAAVYGVADVAFVGGSLVKRGGHNPLEPAQFGVPVVMGPSFENFREIVSKMVDAGGIRIVKDEAELGTAFQELLTERETGRAMGERGRGVFEEQQGATARAVEAIVAMAKAKATSRSRRAR
jgi:3-deoxy-D-manno-octulosonic-acid transferase